METGLMHAHSYLAYLAIIIVAIAAFNAIHGWLTNRAFEAKDRKIALFGLIATHTQMLIGIILYLVMGWYNAFPAGMKDSLTRLKMLEHPLINLIAIALITVAFSKHKKITDSKSKFKAIAIMYSIALILILSRIPWAQWLN